MYLKELSVLKSGRRQTDDTAVFKTLRKKHTFDLEQKIPLDTLYNISLFTSNEFYCRLKDKQEVVAVLQLLGINRNKPTRTSFK